MSDGWSFPIEFGNPTATVASAYTIRSLGKDGILSAGTPVGATSDFNCDIVFQVGQFTSYPQGIQT